LSKVCERGVFQRAERIGHLTVILAAAFGSVLTVTTSRDALSSVPSLTMTGTASVPVKSATGVSSRDAWG
jgi:hypothetical protein